MEKFTLYKGAVVQLNPDKCTDPLFAACFMIVTEPQEWGAKGYVLVPGDNEQPGRTEPYAARWDEMEFIGRAVWMRAERGERDAAQR